MPDNAKTLANAAEDAKVKAEKPLPAMVSPTVNLVAEIRQAIALRCRETGVSFSLQSNKMWLALLKNEKRVATDLSPDFTVKRAGGGASKAKLEEAQNEIAALKAELEKLKAAKK
jgi:hypothetical protein